MRICLYCHNRHMGNHVYQIWYKICMFAEIKTLVKFICIPPLGRAPNPIINNTITCSLPLLSHRYTILRISVSLKLISFLAETQARGATSFRKGWKGKKPLFPFRLLPPRSVPCAQAGESPGKPPSLLPGKHRRAEQRARSPLAGATSHPQNRSSAAHLSWSPHSLLKGETVQPHHSAQTCLFPGCLTVSWSDRRTARRCGLVFFFPL